MDYVIIVLVVFLWIVLALTVRFPSGAGQPEQVAALMAASQARRRADTSATPFGLIFRYLLVIVLLAGIVYALNWPWAYNIFRLVMLCRYGLITAALLVGLVPLGLVVVPGVLGNMFVLRGPWQLFNITWIALLTATTVVVLTRIVEVNAPDRYPPAQWIIDRDAVWGLVRTAAVLLMGLAIPFACFRFSRASLESETPWAPWVGIGLVGGTVFAFVLVLTAVIIDDVFLRDDVRIPGLLPLQAEVQNARKALGVPQSEVLYVSGADVAWLFGYLDNRGYWQCESPTLDGKCLGKYKDPPVLAAGHAQAMIGFGLILIFYMGSYVLMRRRRVVLGEKSSFSPMFYLLLLIMLVGFGLQGAAFALDLHVFPPLLAVVLLSFVLYQFNRTDHFFDLSPAAEKDEEGRASAVTAHVQDGATQDVAPSPPLLIEAARGWKIPPKSKTPDGKAGKKTLIAVTAAGGGIQAAAWISRALVGLHELYRDDFTRSIGLISAVSGGSVGAMYFLDQWNDGPGPVFAPDAVAFEGGRPAAGSICAGAMASSLEATAWGLAFPDFLRTVFPPLVVSRTDDRGSRIEDIWRDRADHPDARLNDWFDLVREGRVPIPVFNATVVETGQRMLCSPVVSQRNAARAKPDDAQELFNLYPKARPRIATAVRLSATFPFVSPICRPLPGDWPEENNYHYADGGYVDNEGMVTVVEWLKYLLDSLPEDQRQGMFDQILIVRLIPFPLEEDVAGAATNKGWFYSFLGPIDALQHVRVASQSERNHIAVGLFAQAAGARGVPVYEARLTFQAEGGENPPLSWMLTDSQKDNVERAWQNILNTPQALGEIDRLFDRCQ